MSQFEVSAIKGFLRMGANCCQIMEVFWYLSKQEIDNVIFNLK